MKKIYRFLSILLVLIVLITNCCFSLQALASTQSELDVYNFPITPDMPKWLVLENHDDKVAACQIPENILKSMSTDALIKTIINYPLAVDIYAYDSPLEGYLVIKEQFNGVKELASRYANAKSTTTKIDNELNFLNKNSSIDNKTTFQSFFLNRIAGLLGNNLTISEFRNTENLQLSRASTTVNTPNGSSVPVYSNLTWSDHGITQSEATAADQQALVTYPGITKKASNSPKYNCHSYAWYSTSTSNIYWMNNPALYITDGSYYSVGNSLWYVNSKIVWRNSGSIIHSGIIISAPEHRLGFIRSKWGVLGVFEHLSSQCPYSGTITGYLRS